MTTLIQDVSYTAENSPQLFLPVDPFPFWTEGHPVYGELKLKANFRSFLKVVREHPAYVEPMQSTFYRLCIRQGTNGRRSEEVQRFSGREIPSFNIFSNQFFGVEEPTYDIIVGYAGQAHQGGRARRKALAITGSPGAGKSDSVNHIQYNILRQAEPRPFLGGSVMWNNVMGVLYLVKLRASKASKRRPLAMRTFIEKEIDSFDLTGTAKLDVSDELVKKIARKYKITLGDAITTSQLTDILLGNEKDFVTIVSAGLGIPKPSIDAFVVPDPWAQDVALGEFAGLSFVKKEVLADAGINFEGSVKGKNRGEDKYGEYDSAYTVATLGDYPIDNMFMSEGQGMVDIAEVQPINFDTKVFIGETNIGAIGRYDDRDPRTVSPNGAFNQGRFIVGTEFFRSPDEGFRIMLEALEGQRIPLPEPLSNYHQQGVGWEGMMLIHSNDEQWNKFNSDPHKRAHVDRLVWVSWKYPLEPTQAAKVNHKLYTASGFGKAPEDGGVHVEPLVWEYIGMFRAATHIDWESKGNMTFMSVLNAYDGKKVRQASMSTEADPRTMRESAPWTEGLDGMSPREMDTILGTLASNALEEASSQRREAACITVAELRDHLIKLLRKTPLIKDEKLKAKWIGWLELPLEKDFRRVELSKIYRAAFIPQFRDLANSFFRRYIETVRTLARGVRQGSIGGQHMNTQQMEQFLQEIERSDALSVNSAQADKFRVNIMVALSEYQREFGNSEPEYDLHEGLKRCIEAYVLRQAKDIVGMIGVTSMSEEQTKRLEGAKGRLISDHGYCPHCAGKLVFEVAQTKDFLVA
jgi:predicted Ser/Thr protein kinase